MTHATLESIATSLAGAFLLTTVGAVALLTVHALAAMLVSAMRHR